MQIKSLYISSHSKGAGKLIITMGMMEFLRAKMGKVAFFKPFSADKTDDHDINFIHQRYGLLIPTDQMVGLDISEVEEYAAQMRLDEMLGMLMEQIKTLEQEYDFVLVEGLPQSEFSDTIGVDLNLALASNLGTAYINVLHGIDKNAPEIIDEIMIDHHNIIDAGCTHFATFVNRLDTETKNILAKSLERQNLPQSTYLLQEIPELDMPTIAEVSRSLGCRIISGLDKDLHRVVKGTKIAAMQLDHFLDCIQEGDLIITPSDRSDIVVGSLMAMISHHYPTISGIVLTGGGMLSDNTQRMLSGLKEPSIPILSYDADTYQAAKLTAEISATIDVESDRKIALSMGLFNSAVDYNHLANQIKLADTETITPMMFEYSLLQKARSNIQKIVLPESTDDRILRACEILLRRDAVEIILLGKHREISRLASTKGIDISKATIIDPETSGLIDEFAQIFWQLRRHKGINADNARDIVSSLSYFGTMMVYCGYADGMVSGAIHTTQETIRPALQIIKTKPGIPIVSSLFFMSMEREVLIYADCAINQNPDAHELATIAVTTADTAREFGFTPRIAMLSYSTGTSGRGDDVDKVAQATQIAKSLRPDLAIEGPIQYDAAIDPDVAHTKLPDSDVAGRATVFVFPDLNTGNNTYKAVQRSTHALAIGPILQGLNKPVNDLSRGCNVADVVSTVLITAIQASGPNPAIDIHDSTSPTHSSSPHQPITTQESL